jgi:hypothetical protein
MDHMKGKTVAGYTVRPCSGMSVLSLSMRIPRFSKVTGIHALTESLKTEIILKHRNVEFVFRGCPRSLLNRDRGRARIRISELVGEACR